MRKVVTELVKVECPYFPKYAHGKTDIDQYIDNGVYGEEANFAPLLLEDALDTGDGGEGRQKEETQYHDEQDEEYQGHLAASTELHENAGSRDAANLQLQEKKKKS